MAGDMVNVTMGSIVIGNILFDSVPIGISLNTENESESVASLRQPGSVIINRGRSKTSLTVQIGLHGDDHVRNAAKLVRMFQRAPFVPIEQETINAQGVQAVALASININTVPGFPGTLMCGMVLLPFNHRIFLPNTARFREAINDELLLWFLNDFEPYDYDIKTGKIKYSKYPIGPNMNDKASIDEYGVVENPYVIHYGNGTIKPQEFDPITTVFDRIINPLKYAAAFNHDKDDRYPPLVETKNPNPIRGQVGYERQIRARVKHRREYIDDTNHKPLTNRFRLFCLRNDVLEEFDRMEEQWHFLMALEGMVSSVPRIINPDTSPIVRKVEEWDEKVKSWGNINEDGTTPASVWDELAMQTVSPRGVDVSSETWLESVRNNVNHNRKNVIKKYNHSVPVDAMMHEIPFAEYGFEDYDDVKFSFACFDKFGEELFGLIEKDYGIKVKEFKEKQIKKNGGKVNKEKLEKAFDDEFKYTLSSDLFVIQGLTVSYQNRLAPIVLSGQHEEAYQFMGGSDIVATMNIVTDEVGLASFKSLNKIIAKQARTHRAGIAAGYMRIDHPLLNMFGMEYCVLSSLQWQTMDGIPNAYELNLSFVSFDPLQRKRESIVRTRNIGDSGIDLIDGYDDDLEFDIQDIIRMADEFKETMPRIIGKWDWGDNVYIEKSTGNEVSEFVYFYLQAEAAKPGGYTIEQFENLFIIEKRRIYPLHFDLTGLFETNEIMSAVAKTTKSLQDIRNTLALVAQDIESTHELDVGGSKPLVINRNNYALLSAIVDGIFGKPGLMDQLVNFKDRYDKEFRSYGGNTPNPPINPTNSNYTRLLSWIKKELPKVSFDAGKILTKRGYEDSIKSLFYGHYIRRGDSIAAKNLGLTQQLESLQQLEVYPDLVLPTYDELYQGIFDRRIRQDFDDFSVITPEIEQEYKNRIMDDLETVVFNGGLFVDPDFYINYDRFWSEDIRLGLEQSSFIMTDSIGGVKQSTVGGYDITSQFISNTNQPIAEEEVGKAVDKLKQDNIWGEQAELLKGIPKDSIQSADESVAVQNEYKDQFIDAGIQDALKLVQLGGHAFLGEDGNLEIEETEYKRPPKVPKDSKDDKILEDIVNKGGYGGLF